MSDSYIADGGYNCPHCESEHIGTNGQPGWPDGGETFQDMKCYDCGANWTDKYVLVAVTDLKIGVDRIGGE